MRDNLCFTCIRLRAFVNKDTLTQANRFHQKTNLGVLVSSTWCD